MSRSLVLGNGSMLVCYDHDARIRDVYYPYVGLENHIASMNANEVGVWVDGVFSWISADTWELHIDYNQDTLVSNIEALQRELGIRIVFEDFVYNEENVLLRQVHVENRVNQPRTIRLFFNQQFTLGGTSHADTAYYNPHEEAIVHYKGRRVFLVSGRANGASFDDYSVGLMNIEGKEGTWRDAEDGELEQNPIEHGSVDSTIRFSLALDSRESANVAYWVCASETFSGAQKIHRMVKRKTPQHILETTHDFWRAWVSKGQFTFHKLDDDVISLFNRSLLIMRTHADRRGGLLASGDGADMDFGRDTYGYVWPRDAAFIANAFDQAGYSDISRNFIEFSKDVLTDDGYILHKYRPDRSLGSSWHPWIQEGKEQLAIQEDETALLLWSLWEHYKHTKDIEFVENYYNPFIKRIADFLVRYRDPETGLPLESYDLWEEKYGVSTFTASTVYGALISASRFADVLGKEEDCRMYHDIAEEMRNAIIAYLYKEDLGYFVKLIRCDDACDPTDIDCTIDASSFFGVFQFNVLPLHDERLRTSFDTLQKELHDHIPAGGVARYVDDRYHQRDTDMPGNPWFVTYLWTIQYRILTTDNLEELEHVNTDLRWVVMRALESDILSEQIDPHTGEQLSVAPLTWSHAEYVRTVLAYMKKVERLGGCDVCKPIE